MHKRKFHKKWAEYRDLCEQLDTKMINIQDDWYSHYNYLKKVSEIKSIKEIEAKIQDLQEVLKNRDSDLDSHCQSKRLKILTQIYTLEWVLNID